MENASLEIKSALVVGAGALATSWPSRPLSSGTVTADIPSLCPFTSQSFCTTSAPGSSK